MRAHLKFNLSGILSQAPGHKLHQLIFGSRKLVPNGVEEIVVSPGIAQLHAFPKRTSRAFAGGKGISRQLSCLNQITPYLTQYRLEFREPVSSPESQPNDMCCSAKAIFCHTKSPATSLQPALILSAIPLSANPFANI
jgi:hypothetical protein